MAKFSGSQSVGGSRPRSVHAATAPALTHEGGAGFSREPKSELYLLAVSNMVGGDTFYEEGKVRDHRFVELVRAVTATDADWMRRFIPYLRDQMGMRSASIVALAEYVKANGEGAHALVKASLLRPDEPAELLGYWLAVHGKRIPKGLKRGFADAAVKLYSETSALKYDGQGRSVRMGDVIELAHPKAGAPWQNELFRYLLDTRHGRAEPVVGEGLRKIKANRALEALPPDARRAAMREAGPEKLAEAGFTWERLGGWLPGGMDAEAWEAIIPSMGVMALLRNLRNFDQAKIGDSAADAVAAKIHDPEAVAKARVFPLRYFSAFKAVQSLRWGAALEKGIRHTLTNVPALPGRTLIMVDNSGSMNDTLSDRSVVTRREVAGLFATALAARAASAVAVAYHDRPCAAWQPKGGEAVLVVAKELSAFSGGTNTWGCTAAALEKFGHFDRIVILTDEQAMDSSNVREIAAFHGNVYTFNLAGYATAHAEHGKNGVYCFGGGLSDACFTMLAALDGRKDDCWPF